MSTEVKCECIPPSTQPQEHQNQWILDIIPDDWADKDYFIELVLCHALIHFWESEKGEELLRYQFEREPDDWEIATDAAREQYTLSKNKQVMVYDKLKAAYEWAKLFVTNQWNSTTAEEYDANTEHLNTIVKYRGWLWI